MMKFLLFTLSLFISAICFSQSIANYAVSRTTGITYSSIVTSGSAVNLWRNNTGTFQQDDNRSQFVNIGFDFWYDGTRYTKICVSTNGFLDFSNSADNGGPTGDDFGYINSAFSTLAVGNATRPACAVFYDDLTAQGGTSPLGNSIRYSLSGIAPNRIFTAEWINMAVFTNTTPSLNFQIKLHESTGLIDFVYGTMNTGTFNFSYTLGINAPNVTGPTIAELKNQITANTLTFTNTPQNGLVTLPSTNSRITFTPPVPLPSSGSLTFTAVTQTSMTLNWPNWATNEVGYVLYNSTDGINYNFVTQTAANATSTNVTGLLPGTLYFWKVFAVTEGCLSTALTASQTTLPATNKVSNVVSGNWNNPGSWLPAGVPNSTDNVTILNGHTITINTDALCNNLTIGQGLSGVLRIGNNGTSRTINVNNNINILVGGQFITNTASDATHILNVISNITNNGTLNFATDVNSLCRANFIKNGNQTISGAGAVNNFSTMDLNMGISDVNTLSITSTNFSAPSNFLVLQNGTFNLANSSATTIDVSTAVSFSIGPPTGITLSNPNATLNFTGSLDLQGNLKITAGTVNIGNAANEGITSNGGEITINGGALNVAGSYVSSTINNLSRFVMSGGTMTVPTVNATASTTLAPFNITSPGSVVIISGGTIIIPREGGTGAQNLGLIISGVIGSSVTGGTLQIGSAATPAGQTMRISTVLPVGNLTVLSNNATAQQANALTILQNVLITSGTFDANNLNTSVGGNWTNNANFSPGNATVTFNGSDLQTITDPTGERFNNLICGSTDTVRLLTNLDIDRNLTINAGSTLDHGAGNQTIDIQRNFTNNGNLFSRNGLMNFNGTLLQQITASTTTRFYNMRVGNAAGVTIVNGVYELEGAYTPASGNFDVGAATSFTLLSNAVSTARIAQATTGTVFGTMDIQRFIGLRSAGYSDMSSPVVSTAFADWDNELLLVYAYAPPLAYPSAYSYDETAFDYVPVTSAATVISPGQGFEVYLDSYGTYATFENTTIDSRGTPVIGDVDVSSSITFSNDGWNLIGNPYASFISWDNLFSASSGVSNSIMIYDEVAADFEVISTGSAFEIAPHQGFWIQANSGSPSVVFTESKKTNSNTSVFKSLENSNFSLKLESKVRSHFFTSKTQFVDLTNQDFDHNIDFKSVPHPLAPKLYSLSETDKKFRIKQLDMSAMSNQIPLGFSVGEDGMYSITASNLDVLKNQEYTCVILVDAVTGNEINLDQNSVYSFFATTNDKENRFSLKLEKGSDCSVGFSQNQNVVFVDGSNSVTVNFVDSDIVNKAGSISVYDMLGQRVVESISLNGSSIYTINLPIESGCYLIVVTENGNTTVHKYVNR
jgi:hypothetical protein